MKKIFSIIISVSMLLPLVFAVNAFAEEFYYGNLTIDGVEYEECGDYCIVYSCDREISGSVVIPPSVKFGESDLPVTEISGWAFSDCEMITDITLPDSITVIEQGAFSGCYALRSVNIPSGVTEIREITFDCCESLENIILPEGLQLIGSDAFFGCHSLKGVIIPDTVTEIGFSAFEECDCFTSVKIPANVSFIGTLAFSNCPALLSIDVDENNPDLSSQDGVLFNKDKTVLFQFPSGKAGEYTIPDSVTEIYEYAFAGNSQITNVIIPDSVKAIGFHAFSGCFQLNSISVPVSVEEITDGAFCDCRLLKEIKVDDKNAYFRSIDGVLFNKEGTTLLSYPNSRSDEYEIPDGTKEIAGFAFFGCCDVTKLTFPDSVSKMGDYVFNWCGNLDYTVYKNGMYLGNDANKYMIFVSVVDNETESLEIHESTKFISSDSCYDMTNLKSLIIPDGVKSIGAYAFCDCDLLSSVKVGKDVERIGEYAFAYCYELENIDLPEALTVISEGLLCSCEKLTDVEIPDGVTEIKADAFLFCTGMQSVTLPKTVTEIGEGAFWICDSLETVNYKGTMEQFKKITIESYNESLTAANTVCSDGTYTAPDEAEPEETEAEGEEETEKDTDINEENGENEILPGDCNKDGNVDNKDVVVLFRYASGAEKEEDESIYDYNSDGEVNNKDVVALFRYLSAN